MTNLFKINKILSTTIFFLSLIFLSLFYLKINLIITTPVCFFLIATIGISHGSLDHLKGYKILKFYKISINFYFT